MESVPAQLPKLSQKHGVKFLGGPLITTEHKAIGIVEAKDIESLRRFIMEGGFTQWNSVQILHGVTLDESLKEVAALKPIF